MRPGSPRLVRAVRDAAARLRDRMFADPLQAFDFGLDLSGSFDAADGRRRRTAAHSTAASIRDTA